MLGSEDVLDDEADECITKVCTNMGGEVLDPWVNLLPVNNPWKCVNGESILNLD